MNLIPYKSHEDQLLNSAQASTNNLKLNKNIMYSEEMIKTRIENNNKLKEKEKHTL